jgi:hypothetical protein
MLTVCLRCDQYLLLKATILATPRFHQLVVRIAGRESEDGEASSVPRGQLHVVARGSNTSNQSAAYGLRCRREFEEEEVPYG